MVQEDIGLVHEMPRAIVHFTSPDSAEDAPRAYMTIHVGEDGTTYVPENFLTPVKTTDVLTCRLDDLNSETVARLVDRFLAKAMQGQEANRTGMIARSPVLTQSWFSINHA
ncbi:hypothetical protein [Azospirillum sp. B506]|uniref:hypothetical protein n=1 Tax=Azospirillum sp. B506 TaxID=137721 RepID=UPI00034679F9|nr:hypothetical protein [Azospirillum sp. B506]